MFLGRKIHLWDVKYLRSKTEHWVHRKEPTSRHMVHALERRSEGVPPPPLWFAPDGGHVGSGAELVGTPAVDG